MAVLLVLLPMALAAARLPARAGTWHEVYLQNAEASLAPSTAESFQRGHSAIVVDSFATASERELLMRSAALVAESLGVRNLSDPDPGATVPRDPANPMLRLSIATRFDAEAQEVSAALFRRLLRLLEGELPFLAEALFGRSAALAELNATWYEDRADVGAGPEPMVNLYEAGGHLEPHRDGKQLTILVPLSAEDAFAGGGTAFWGDADGAAPPTVLRPAAGSALLWGGKARHAGHPVDAGTRLVFVGSFSLHSERRWLAVRVGATIVAGLCVAACVSAFARGPS